MKRLFRWAIVFPILLVASFLLIANRHNIFISLDPFNAEQPALSFEFPLYLILLLMLFIGIITGGILTWLGQHKYRKASRIERNNADKWHHEADSLRKRAEKSAHQAPPTEGQASTNIAQIDH